MKQLVALGLSAALAVPALPAAALAQTPTGIPLRKPTRIPLEAMIGQMIMVGFRGTKPSDPGVEAVMEQLRKGQIGGVILLGFNITGPKQLGKLTSALHEAAREGGQPRPLIAVDQEGGAVQRLKAKNKHEGFPYSARTIARSCTPEQAYAVYRALACQLRAAGINLNFGPVVDLDSAGEKNPIIGRLGRSYGKSANEVIAYAIQFNRAHKVYGILTAAKHYPGHGSSLKDSHKGFTDISKTWDKNEQRPYEALARANGKPDDAYADMVMVGHLYHPAFSDGRSAPASLSNKAIERRLRLDMDYRGVVITDDLQMKAVLDIYPLRQRIALAVNAGNDILLFSNTAQPRHNFGEIVFQLVKEAVDCAPKVEPHCINLSRVRESYDRIVALKGAPLDRFDESLARCRPLGRVKTLFEQTCKKKPIADKPPGAAVKPPARRPAAPPGGFESGSSN